MTEQARRGLAVLLVTDDSPSARIAEDWVALGAVWAATT